MNDCNSNKFNIRTEVGIFMSLQVNLVIIAFDFKLYSPPHDISLTTSQLIK